MMHIATIVFRSLVAAAALISCWATLPAGAQEAQPLSVAELARLRDFEDWVQSVAFSPDGKLLAAGTYQAVKLFDVESRKELASMKVPGYGRDVAFSPDGSQLAAGGYRAAVVWDVKSREEVRQLKGHTGYVTAVAFSPDGKQLATSSEDQTVRLWSAAGGKPGQVIEGYEYPVNDLAWSPDGKWIATASGDEARPTRPGEMRVVDAATGELKFKPEGHEKAATGVAVSPDGKLIASTGEDEKANVYDATTGQPIGYFAGHSRATNDVVFASGGSTLISASGGRAGGKNEVKVWSRQDGEEIATIEGHEGQVNAVALSPDEKVLATASHDGTVALWDIAPVLTKAAEMAAKPTEPAAPKELRAGIIGLDTSHVIAFTNALNADKKRPEFEGVRIVAAYPKGSPDIESSVRRVAGYTEQVRDKGVEIVDSIEELLERVDVVFLETNDGRPHLEQVLPVLKARKRVFIDKPVAGSLSDAVAIFEASRKYNTPVFSSSSLRFVEGAQALRNGKIGDILGCDAYSPCALEPTHPDLFWYGIHGVETLFTVMGTGCESVSRTSTPDFEFAVGRWEDGRIGTFRGVRKGNSGYGGTAFGSKGVAPIGSWGEDGPYVPLLVEIVKFFRTGESPVAEDETLEIYAFMEAADESKRQGGAPVTLESVLAKARADAEERIAKLE